MNRRLPLYIADLCESSDRMLSLSIVKRPAIGLPWKVLENTEDKIKVFAPIITANKPIYRNNEAYGEHYVMFTPDVISDIIADCSHRNVSFDIEHDGTPIKGVYWIESLQIDYSVGKQYKAYPSLTDGSWVGVLEIEKQSFKGQNMVNGASRGGGCPSDFSGISISGIFTYHEVTLSEAIEFYNKIKF